MVYTISNFIFKSVLERVNLHTNCMQLNLHYRFAVLFIVCSNKMYYNLQNCIYLADNYIFTLN